MKKKEKDTNRIIEKRQAILSNIYYPTKRNALPKQNAVVEGSETLGRNVKDSWKSLWKRLSPSFTGS
jgi:hypothetical protein